MPLGIGMQPVAGLADGAMLADAGDDILQRPAFRHVIMNVASRHQRHIRGPRDRGQFGKAPAVVTAIEIMGREIAGRCKTFRNPCEARP